MKKLISLLALFLVISVLTNCAEAQRKGGWIAQNGFWEVITNKNDPSSCTVQFYNLNSKLIYEEKVTGKSIDLHKRHICRILNKTLKKALLASMDQKIPLQDKQWVGLQMRTAH